MRIIDHIKQANAIGKTTFSFEILPPTKGKNISGLYRVIDKLKEFDPKYINITTHHSVYEESLNNDGSLNKAYIRKRPGTVAIAAAIQHRYGITAVPHIICSGFSLEETEYALIDLHFLGIENLLLLQGDNKGKGNLLVPSSASHAHATDLIEQVNAFNNGISLDGSPFEAPHIPFSYGVAGYPEMHEEAISLDSDMHYLKQKIALGADYIVTQMFFDNQRYFEFVDRCRAEGITVPIIPGIKPINFCSQRTVIPKIFHTSFPEDLDKALSQCTENSQAVEVGVEWSTTQCRELITKGVPGLHFYSLLASESVYRIAQSLY